MSATFSTEMLSKLPPTRLFECAVVDAYKFVPKALPHIVASVTHLEGNGEVGSIRLFKLQPGLRITTEKQRIEVLDRRNMEYKYSIIEGGEIGTKYALATHQSKVEATTDGGSILRLAAEFQRIPGIELTQEDVKEEERTTLVFYKFMERYLLDNPDAERHAPMSTGFCAEFSSSLPPARFFRHGFVQVHQHAAKAMPSIIKNVVQLEGNGGVGTIRIFELVPGLPYSFQKELIKLVNREEMKYKYEITDGASLGEKYSAVTHFYQVIPSPDGGCIVRLSAEYTKIPGVEFSREDVKVEEMATVEFFKGIEKYLIENKVGMKA